MARGHGTVGTRGHDWLERAAIGASALCLIHCLALPLLFAALPILSRLVALPEQVHVWLLAFAVPTSGAALLLGRGRYMDRPPLVTGATGLALLSVSALFLANGRWETPVTVCGSLCLAAAHVTNWRRRHRHRDC